MTQEFLRAIGDILLASTMAFSVMVMAYRRFRHGPYITGITWPMVIASFLMVAPVVLVLLGVKPPAPMGGLVAASMAMLMVEIAFFGSRR